MKRVYAAFPLIVLLIVLIALAVPMNQASAAIRPCRTDPIFVLSNGDTLSVDLEIGTDAANVKNMMFVVHVPEGVTVTQVILIGDNVGDKETYKIYQDSPANTYTTDTVVTVQNSGSVTVKAITTLNSTYTAVADGFSGKHLVVTIVKP